MDVEFLKLVFAQMPTFAGLLILAWIQYRDNVGCEEAREKTQSQLANITDKLLEARLNETSTKPQA